MCSLVIFFFKCTSNKVWFFFKVSWIRHKDLHIFSVGLLKYTSDSRYDIVHRPSTRFGFIKTNVYFSEIDSEVMQRYTYRVLQTVQMKLLLLCVWAERAVLGSAITALNFKYEI